MPFVGLSLGKLRFCVQVAASYPPILERKETSELIDHVLKRAGVVEAAAEITPTAAVPVPDAPTTKVSVSELSPTGEVTAAPELEARGKGKADCDGSPLLYQPDCGKFTETTVRPSSPNMLLTPILTRYVDLKLTSEQQSSTPPPPPPTSSVIVTKPTPLPTIPPLVIGGPSSTVEPSPDPNLLTPVYSDIGDNGPPPVDVSDDSYCWQGPEGQVHCVWTNIPKGKPKRTAAPVPGDMVARGADALPMPTTFATEVKRGDDKKTHGGPRLPKFT